MPYDSTKDLPSSVTNNLPPHGQTMFLEAYNSAWEQYKDEDDRRGDDSRKETSSKVAWSAVINPELYGEAAVAVKVQYNVARDALEQKIINYAVKNNIPLLGICRGMQMINITLGGTLYQNAEEILEDFLPNESLISKIIGRREVSIDKTSRLFNILGEHDSYLVNSIHHQAIHKLGKNLKVVAKEENGLIQAFEQDKKNNSFLIGVQWHPELMLHAASARNLFKELISMAKS